MSNDIEINDNTIAGLSLAVSYTGEHGRHRDVMHFDQFRMWADADYLPMQIQLRLIAKKAGYREKFCFKKGELVKAADVCLVHTMANQDFNRQPRRNLDIEPRFGRYYPAGWFNGITGNQAVSMAPVRITHIDEEMIQVDFNHALSEHDLEIEIEIFSVAQASRQNTENSNHCIEKLLGGPGMQLRASNRATDFFSDDPYQRIDSEPDEIFYHTPRLVNHLDDSALQQLGRLYGELIPADAVILDLMSSLNSHLSQTAAIKQVTGVGMNLKELDANQALDQRLVQDLNEDTTLPFADNHFDIVLCTVSIEYLLTPAEIFEQVARVLKPGGKFIITFSNRWFPTKAIQLWSQLHEFERLALVSEYFINSGHFKALNTYSLRGLPRPQNDRHRIPLSDPLYAVWAIKS